MRKKNRCSFEILVTIILTCLVIFLTYSCFRIFISIIRTFIYLTGLTVIFLMITFLLFVIGYFVYSFLVSYKCYKRYNIDLDTFIEFTIITQLKLCLFLFLSYVLLTFIKFIL